MLLRVVLSGKEQLFRIIELAVSWVVVECCKEFCARCEAGVDFYGDEEGDLIHNTTLP